MLYYKIIVDLKIVGVATSNNFFRYLPAHFMLERTSQENAEYIESNNHLYHAKWMQPIQTEAYLYEVANIISIDEEEYNILVPAIENAPIDIEDEETPIDIDVLPDPIDEETFNFVRNSKINQMSNACRTTIESGFDLDLRGETHHFSLTTQDQLNLMNLSAMIQTQDLIPYHADGEETLFYSADEINQIIAAANQFKIYQTTYYNALKTYINALETIEEIAAIEYGVTIPEEYKSDVLRMLEQ